MQQEASNCTIVQTVRLNNKLASQKSINAYKKFTILRNLREDEGCLTPLDFDVCCYRNRELEARSANTWRKSPMHSMWHEQNIFNHLRELITNIVFIYFIELGLLHLVIFNTVLR